MNKNELVNNLSEINRDVDNYKIKILIQLRENIKDTYSFYNEAMSLLNEDKLTIKLMLKYKTEYVDSKLQMPNFKQFRMLYNKLRHKQKTPRGLSEVYMLIKKENNFKDVNDTHFIQYINKIILDDINKDITFKQEQGIKNDTTDTMLRDRIIKNRIERQVSEMIKDKYDNDLEYFVNEYQKYITKINNRLETISELTNDTTKNKENIIKYSEDITILKQKRDIANKKLNEVLDFKKHVYMELSIT